MAIFPSSAIPSGASAFTLDQSLKFEDGDSPYLSRSTGTWTDGKRYTLSMWVKRGNLSSTQMLFTNDKTSGGNTGFTQVFFNSSDKLYMYFHSSAGSSDWISDAVFRDSSAWLHIVHIFDSANGTAEDRGQLYVNGTRLTSASGWDTDVPVNLVPEFTETPSMFLGIAGGEGALNNGFDGYIAEVHFIDGTAVAASSFGETGDYGEWKPIEVEGLTYGNNGFYLPFKQDYEVEGFNTVTYRGNDATQYIGGVGFSPDLVWIKTRSAAEEGRILDQVRGLSNALCPSTTGAEATDETNGLTAYHSDGFSLGGADNINGSGNSIVAWCWDMGGDSYGVPSTIEVAGNTNHSTTQEKIGDTSIRFDGTDDYLTVPDSSDWDFGTNDFTIEGWVRFDATGSSEQLFSRLDARVGSNFRTIYIKKDDDDTLITRYGTGDAFVTSENKSTETLSANTWYHIAVTRQNDSFSTYLDGVRLSSMDETSTVDIQGDTPFVFGAIYTDSSWVDEFTGYMDEIRISNKCRYTSNFTAPTTAFSNDANTVLLIHSDTSNGSTTFVDSSGATKNTTGSITSYVAANPTYGQSIVTYDGNNGGTVGHGLNSAPNMLIWKQRDGTDAWMVWHSGYGNNGFQQLNTTAAAVGEYSWFMGSTAPSSTLVTMGNGGTVNASGNSYVMYAFHDVTGYSKFGSYTGNGNATGPSVTTGFKPAFVLFKRTDSTSSWTILDNTRNPTNPIDDHMRAQTSDSEMTSDPASIADFTSTGFQIKTATDANDWNTNSGTYIYAAFADKREYAYWLDQSGNNNDWTSNNLTESDISVDSPTNNFATLNPISTAATYSEGNTKVTTTVAGSDPYKQIIFSTFSVNSGKYYWEYNPTDMSGVVVLGCSSSEPTNSNKHNNWGSTGANLYAEGGGVYAASNEGTFSSYIAGDIIGVALDMDNNRIYFAKNNTWQDSANPSSGTGYFTITNSNNGYQCPVISNDHTSSNCTVIANFGQDSSFAGTKTAQGNQDGNDIGDFYYTPPTGFLALCTSNLPAVAVTPSEHFNTVIYTGDGDGSSKTISGVGFQPDFIWIKDRSTALDHNLSDAVRGVTKNLFSNTTGAETTDAESIQSFNADGFTVGNANNINNDHPYVAWNWKANGSGSSNTTGSINTTATSANVDAGFSISTYTGNGTSGATVGHGLSKAPEMIIIKSREATWSDNWGVGHIGLNGGSSPWDEVIRLNLTSAEDNQSNAWNDTAPSSTLVTLGNGSQHNASSEDYVMYCFHSVDGYSKVGSYTGNADADGTFVYTGFRPAYVMWKRYDGAGQMWMIHDNARSTYNPSSNYLAANNSNIEASYPFVDFTSNGFKQRHTSSHANGSSEDYIYIAFAETPFKYSNAR